MPAVTRVVFYDDESWPEQVPAEEAVRLTLHWQAIDAEGTERGKRDVELYLTAEARRRIEKDLASWFELGHRPGSGFRAQPAEARTRWRGGSRAGSIGRHREMREFFTAWDVRSRKDPSRLCFQTPSGSWSYPEWAVEMYEKWVAAGRPPAGKAS